MQNIDETPTPVTETSPVPAVIESEAIDPVMEELLRQKEQLLKEIKQQELAYAEEIRKQKETLEKQHA